MTEHLTLMAPGAEARVEHAEIHAPHDGTLIATIDRADQAAADRALATAHALYRDRDAWLPAPERIEILRRTAEIMQERRESLAVEAAREGGKPLVDSRVEVDRAIDGVHLCIEHVRTTAGRGVPMGVNAASTGRVAFTQLEPIGVVLAFSAFNHPLNLIVHQAAPAIATGCPVVVKPAEATPLSCMRFVEIVREAGLPDGWCQALLTENLDIAGSMVADPRVGFFTFIGSGKVGWMLRSRLAAGARCALEHGGAAPVIFGADADVDAAVPL
ncbi:MAG: aldehyde dehydrogenase family protein, partial [Planctomycetota bacterium]